tara:strand:+ start:35 stop:682 length:648 start_codon:yes stop_codon:yes gene_type:complete
MLSFAAHSELPLGDFESSPHRNVGLTGVVGTTGTPGLSVGGDRAFALAGIAATSAVQDSITTATVIAKGNVTPTGVVGTSAAGAADGIGFIATSVTGVAGTSALSAVSATGKHKLSSLVATGGLGIGVTAESNFTIASVSATATFGDFADEDAQGSTPITGVSASGAVNWNSDDPDIPNGIYRAPEVIFLNTDFRRTATVNIVPYKDYKVYITRR